MSSDLLFFKIKALELHPLSFFFKSDFDGVSGGHQERRDLQIKSLHSLGNN